MKRNKFDKIDVETLAQLVEFMESKKNSSADVEIDEDMENLLKRCGDYDFDIAHAASKQLAQAITEPVKEGVPYGDIVSGLYTTQVFKEGRPIEYQTFIQPGDEGDFVATIIPSEGAMPENRVVGDVVTMQTYEIGADITTQLRFMRNASYDVVGKMAKWLAASVVRKNNRDGWQTILAACQNRGVFGYDSQAASGVLSKRALSVVITLMQRNGGGNVNSLNRKTVTDFFISPEGLEDIRHWDLTQIDDLTRREIIMSDENDMVSIFKKFIHAYPEFGSGQEFQLYWTNTLAQSVPGSKTEIGVALDLRQGVINESLVHPVRDEMKVFSNAVVLHPQNKFGLYVRGEHGWGVLDNRVCMTFSF